MEKKVRAHRSIEQVVLGIGNTFGRKSPIQTVADNWPKVVCQVFRALFIALDAFGIGQSIFPYLCATLLCCCVCDTNTKHDQIFGRERVKERGREQKRETA